jgi:30S ribosomal protein S31
LFPKIPVFHYSILPIIFGKKFFMGKGDRKSRKGKIFMGSYGKSRPRKRKKTMQAATVAAPASAEPKAKKKPAAAKKKKSEE